MAVRDYDTWKFSKGLTSIKIHLENVVHYKNIGQSTIHKRVLASAIKLIYKMQRLSHHKLGAPRGISTAKKFTSFECDKLKRLNSYFEEIETSIKDKARRLRKELKQKVLLEHGMYDYEIEVEIRFHLIDTDPEFDDNMDNIMAEIRERIFHDSDYDLFPKYGQHLMLSKSDPFSGFEHCYLFHQFYDYHFEYLSFKDIFRVGEVTVDYIVYHQYKYPVQGSVA